MSFIANLPFLLAIAAFALRFLQGRRISKLKLVKGPQYASRAPAARERIWVRGEAGWWPLWSSSRFV